MITIKKLKTLNDDTRIRKATLLLKELARMENVDVAYLKELLLIIKDSSFGSDERVLRISNVLINEDIERRPFLLEDLHYRLLTLLGTQTADWDFTDEEASLDGKSRIIREFYVVIDRIRSPFNLGSIFRLADSFGVKKILIVEGGTDPTHQRCVKVSRGTTETVEYEVLNEEEVIELLRTTHLPIFALESGGVDLNSFEFPPAGICIIGSEELGVSPDLLSLCDQSLGRVSISLGGTKGSLNVTSATAIMLQAWYSR